MCVFQIDMKEESHLSLFSQEDIVYLTPDSKNVLTRIDSSKVYILGGLVDECVSKVQYKYCVKALILNSWR